MSTEAASFNWYLLGLVALCPTCKLMITVNTEHQEAIMLRALAVLLLSTFSGNLLATTWGESTVKDPITGSDCSVAEPMSSGSYIYQWPSKYDGVYWPFIDSKWIWHCPESGYTSFADDFDKLSPDEIAATRSFLEANYKKPNTPISIDFKLWLLESLYKARNKDPAFWAWFKRVKAYLYEELAAGERHDAIPLLEAEIKSLEPSFELVQKLYVLGDYYRREGEDAKAEDLFQKALSIKWLSEEGEENTGSPYIEEIINERRELMKKTKE